MGATFVMALFSFGLGFYGITVYVATLQRLHGWSAAAVSAPVTRVLRRRRAPDGVRSATLYERLGPRVVVAGGSARDGRRRGGARPASPEPWQLYPAFLVMSVGWGAMSGAAINIILAPWLERRRGLAVSIAFNGATLGGVLVVPALILLIDAARLHARAGRRGRRSRSSCCSPSPPASCGGARPTLGLGPDGDRRPCRARRGAGAPRARGARRRAAHVALLERVGAVRARPRRAGRRAHAPGRARDARPRRAAAPRAP